MLNQFCKIFHCSEHFQAIDPHLYTCKKNVSSHFCALRAVTKESFLHFMKEEFGFECNSGLGLNPSFKKAVIAK